MAVDPVQYIDKGQQYFQRYSYADNNPYKYTDPSGEFIVGATVGAVLSVVYQATFEQEIKMNQVLTDAALGAVGFGLASRLKQVSKTAEGVGEAIFDAGTHMANDYADPDKEVDPLSAVINAAIGKVGNKIGDETKKILDKSLKVPAKIKTISNIQKNQNAAKRSLVKATNDVAKDFAPDTAASASKFVLSRFNNGTEKVNENDGNTN